MSSRRYVGKTGTDGTNVATRLAMDQRLAANVSRDSVRESVSTAAASLARTDYVDGQDNNLATPQYFQQQDGLLLPLSQKGVANGYASLDSSAKIPTAQLPTFGAGRWRGPYDLTTKQSANVTPSSAAGPNSARVSNSSFQDHYAAIGTWSLPAPGFRWRPMVFLSVLTRSYKQGSVDGTEYGQPAVEVRMGTSPTGTIVAYGRGGQAIYGYQGFAVVPTTDLPSGSSGTAQTGVPVSGYAATSTVSMTVWLHGFFTGVTVDMPSANYFTAVSLYLVDIDDDA